MTERRGASLVGRLSAVLLVMLLGSLDRAFGFEPVTLDWRGAERSALVALPETWATPRAMVVALHGGGGNPQQFIDSVRLERLAEVGLMVVVPAGTPAPLNDRLRTWNAGLCCGNARDENVDDVGFLTALIERLAAEQAIPADRVFLTGHSNGAQMTYRLVCERPGLVAAAMPLGSQPAAPCLPIGGSTDILHLHGLGDPCARFVGGTCGGCYAEALSALGLDVDDPGWPCAAVPAAIDAWAAAMQCQPATPATGPGLSEWTGCRGGVAVRLLTYEGGHPWPGGAEPAPCQRRPRGRLCQAYRSAVGPIPALDATAILGNYVLTGRLPTP